MVVKLRLFLYQWIKCTVLTEIWKFCSYNSICKSIEISENQIYYILEKKQTDERKSLLDTEPFGELYLI